MIMFLPLRCPSNCYKSISIVGAITTTMPRVFSNFDVAMVSIRWSIRVCRFVSLPLCSSEDGQMASVLGNCDPLLISAHPSLSNPALLIIRSKSLTIQTALFVDRFELCGR